MKHPNQPNVLIPTHKRLTRRSLRREAYLVAGLLLAVACLAVSSRAIAQCQQGCDATHFNAYLGDSALVNNTSGADDVAIGESALRYNSTGDQNTGVGAYALTANTIGVNDTAIGYAAMNVGGGSDNTAVGAYSLLTCSGNSNTATGSNAMGEGNVTGNNNT